MIDTSRVEESYSWRDDIMEITRRIVHETDEARLSNIAEHFKVDLSEIRDFIEMKRQQKRKPTTHYDEIHTMSAEELAQWIASRKETCPPINGYKCSIMTCGECRLDYLKQEAEA